ncbi:MAG: hypothetical protein ABIJ34_06500 [archaeon]
MPSKDTVNELKNPWFWIYLLSLTLTLLAYALKTNSKTINLGSLFILSIIQLIYGIFQINSPNNKTNWDRYNSIGYGILLLICAFINLSVKVNEPDIAVSLLLLVSGLMMTGFALILFNKLWESKTLFGTIVFYILFIFALNYLFAFGYSISSGFTGNSIIDYSGHNIEGADSYIYYSYSNFYNSIQGNISQGVSRILSLLQVVISYIFHIIILGCIIQRKLICK